MTRNLDTDTASHTGDWIMGAAGRNPEALLLMAAGAVLLMRGGGKASARVDASSRDRGSVNLARSASTPFSSAESVTSGTKDRVSSYAADIKDRAGSYVADVKDRVSDTASAYADTVSDFASDAGRSISETTERMTRRAQSTMDWVLRDQPLAVALVGLAAGAAVAAALPSTEIENRTFGSAREALTDAAKEAGQNLMGAAGKAGERLKGSAAEHGLSSEGLKNIAGDVAETFTDAVKGKSQDKSQDKSQNMAAATMVPASPSVAADVAAGGDAATRSSTTARPSEPRGRSNR